MQRCIELSRIALARGNPPVGAVIVYDGKIIGQGIESGKSTGDITNHAEILSIRDAVHNQKQGLLRASVMYTTHEPCVMCSYVIRHHGIARLVYGSKVDYVGGVTSPFKILETEHVPRWGKPPQIESGLCEQACIELTHEYLRYLSNQPNTEDIPTI
ncbi:MAG: tRNA adenosine(34) deaminase TadA [Phycisphaeraceae bacterium]